MSTAKDPGPVTADELRGIIEQYEQMEAEKAAIGQRQVALLMDASRRFDVRTILRLVEYRRQPPDERAEADAVFNIYREALGES